MNEVQKQNDIFISAILNPQASVTDLLANGINADNTGLFSPEVYKNSKFVQEQFKDESGNFDVAKFNEAYTKANKQYDEMTSYKSYKDLEKVLATYDPNDIFAPLNATYNQPTFEILKVRNPYKTSYGLSSLYAEGERTLSDRELAQKHKVWDSTEEKWLDYTAEDRGFLANAFGEQLVYATWDEDGWHEDASLGRKVYHHKGQMKTDDYGEYYTETAGNRELYNKEFVALGDVLTKEDSWINKVDFFDSDGLTKSAAGTTFKLIALVTPYMIPYLNIYYGGLVASYNLLGVMPTFAKMLEGIAPGDHPEFLKKMNTWENYFHRFDTSYSDQAKDINWNYEKVTSMVADVFGQLYQMRALSSLSLLKNSRISAEQSKLFTKFANEFGESYYKVAADPKSKLKPGIVGMAEWWNKMAAETPEIKALIDSQSKLSKSLSLGYMALTSSADVFGDALLGGYDRTTAGLAALTATAGQYLLMMNNRMGDWFLDATTGYKEGISKKVMLDIMRENYDELAEGTKALAKAATQEEKTRLLAGIFDAVYNKGIKGFFNIIKNGGEEFWKRSIIEGTEEVTEEAVMDMSKGVFDFATWMGWTPNKEASFGGFGNVFSELGATRYMLSLLGGLMGGALFEFLGNVMEPGIKRMISKTASPEVKASLIREIANGHMADLKEAVHILCSADNEINSLAVKVDGDNADISKLQNVTTRGQLIELRLNAYLDYMEAIIVANDAKISDKTLFAKLMRDEYVIPLLEESEVYKIMLSDFNKSVSDLVDALIELDEELAKTPDSQSETEAIKLLKHKLSEKQKAFNSFINGENSEKYVQATLMYLHANIRERALNLDKYSWTKARYNISYNDKSIPDTGEGLSRATIDREYEEWRTSEHPEQKFVLVVVPAYDAILQTISPTVKAYVDTYLPVRTKSLREVLSGLNLVLGQVSTNDMWLKILGTLTAQSSNEQLEGLTLLDIYLLDESELDSLFEDLLNGLDAFLRKYAEIANISYEEAKKEFTTELAKLLLVYPLSTLSKLSLDNLALLAASKQIKALFDSLKTEGEVSKESIDLLITSLGYSPNPNVVVTTDKEKLDYLASILAPRFAADAELDLKSTVIGNYIENNTELDNEVLSSIKRNLLQTVIANREEIKNALLSVLITQATENKFGEIEETTAVLGVSNDDLDRFVRKFETGIALNQLFEEIINDFLFNENDGIITEARKSDKEYLTLETLNPEAAQQIQDALLKTLRSNSWDAKLYNKAISKKIITNPLMDLFANFAFEVSKSDNLSNLIELLKSESNHLSKLRSTNDYLRYGITLELIENFIKLLDLFEAVVYGMEEITDVSFDNPIAYNLQMRRFKSLYENQDASKYETISTEAVSTIINDLELLKNKLELMSNIIRANTASQLVEDLKTEEVHLKLLLKHLLDNASKLTLKGVSIIPPQDLINSKQTTAEKIAFIEHEVYKNFLTIKLEDRAEAISLLISTLGLDKRKIILSGLKSLGLNSKIKSISQYDLFVYWATLLSVDLHLFLSKYQNLLNESWYKDLPKYTQELAIKIGYAFYADKNGIHDLFVEELFKGIEKPELNKVKSIYFLNGVSGAGKTSNVARGIYYLMRDSDPVFIVGPNSIQTNNLKDSITKNILRLNVTTLDKAGLLQLFFTLDTLQTLERAYQDPSKSDIVLQEALEDGSKKYNINIKDSLFNKNVEVSKLPKVIFIDEVTHFTSVELLLLDAIASKYKIKIVSLGDTLQKGASIGKFSSNIDEISAWRPPRLLVSTRTLNIHSKDNVDSMATVLTKIEDILVNTKLGSQASNAAISDLLSNGITLKYFEKEDELHGHKLVSEITKTEIERIAKAAKKSGRPFGILANMSGNELSNSRFKNTLTSLGLTRFNPETNSGDYILYSPEDFSPNAVLGSEELYFIIKDAPLSGSKDQKLKALYTYLTRSLVGTVAQVSTANQTALNISNQSLSYTDLFSLPSLDKAEQFKKEKVDQIQTLISDYIPQAEETQEIKKIVPVKKSAVVTKEVVNEELSDPSEIKDRVDESIEAEAHPKDFTLELPRIHIFTEEKLSLHGYASYNHMGLEKRGEKHYFYCPEHKKGETTSYLDFDGLLPPTVPITYRSRLGMSKFQNLLALFPDIKSAGFKDGMGDHDILYLFLLVNPELGLNADGVLPDNEDDRLINVYSKLVSEENLLLDKTAYVFGKPYESQKDGAKGFPTTDENEALKDEETLILYGYRIYTKDHVINLYISTGCFPKSVYLHSFADNIPSGVEIETTIDELINSGKKFVVLSLGEAIFTPKAGLRVLKPKSGEENMFYDIAHLQSSGLFVDIDNAGVITTTKNGDNFAFLEFKAKYEANGDPDLEKQKLELFNKPVSEGGFILEVPNETGTIERKLACAGQYFAPVQYTLAQSDPCKLILILEPKSYLATLAVGIIKQMLVRSRNKNLTTEEQALGTVISRAEYLSPYSQTKVILNILHEVGALDDSGQEVFGEVDGELVSVSKLYLQAAYNLMLKSKNKDSFSDSIEFIEEFLNNNKFDEKSISDFLKKTLLFGIFFIDANIAIKLLEGDKFDLVIKNLLSDKSEYIPIKSLDNLEVRVNFNMSKLADHLGMGYMYNKILFRNNGISAENLGLKGHKILMPIFNLINDTLSKAKVVENAPENDTQRKKANRTILITKTTESDLSDKSFEVLKKNFDETSISLTTPNFSVNKELKNKYRQIEKGHLVSITNKFGWHIQTGDTVEVYGNTKPYTVTHIDKTKKVISILSDEGQTHKISADAVSKVVTRVWWDLKEQYFDYYKRPGWNKLTNPETTKESAEEKKIKYNDRIISINDFRVSDLDFDKDLYFVIPFTAQNAEGEPDNEYLQIVTRNNVSWTMFDSKEQFDEWFSSLDEEPTGYLIIRANKFNSKGVLNNISLISSEDNKNIITLVNKKFSKDGNLGNYMQNVLLLKPYNPDLSSFDELVELPKKGKEEKLKKYGELTAQLFIEVAQNERPIFRSTKDATLAGFNSREFFYELLSDGTVRVHPKLKFYTNNNIEPPHVELPLVENSPLYIKTDLNSSKTELTISKVEIAQVAEDGFIFRYPNGNVFEDQIKSKDEIGVLFGIKYFSELPGTKTQDVSAEDFADFDGIIDELKAVLPNGLKKQTLVDLNLLSTELQPLLAFYANKIPNRLKEVLLDAFIAYNKAGGNTSDFFGLEGIDTISSETITQDNILELLLWLETIIETKQTPDDLITCVITEDSIDIKYTNNSIEC